MEEHKQTTNTHVIRAVGEFERSKSFQPAHADPRSHLIAMRAQQHPQPQARAPINLQAPAATDPSSLDSFRKLGIIEPIIQSIAEQGFTEPTEIQYKSIPLVLAGKDVIARAATGSGKTLAFGSAIIQNLRKGHGLQALILTPTRELAEQDARALKLFSKYVPLRMAAVYGGVAIGPQMNALRSADVVVGTPGRLLDHMERNTIRLSDVSILVLDEADRMLDMGFIDDVQRIMKACPRNGQTLLFSATISSEIISLAQRYMNEPVTVMAESYVDPAKLHQVYYDVPDSQKFSLFVHMMKHESSELVMVFCNTRHSVNFVTRNLNLAGVEATPIHGGFTQAKRTKALDRFHSQKTQVLVCTDVAARGLDIPHVSHIYNYDIPKEAKQYIHRIGRTARAGAEGKVINILSSRDYDNFTRVMRENGIRIKREELPQFDRVNIVQAEPRESREGYNRGPRRENFRRGPGGHGGHGGQMSRSPRSFGGGRSAPRRSFNRPYR